MIGSLRSAAATALRLTLAVATVALVSELLVAPRAGAQEAGGEVALRQKFTAGERWAFDEDMTLAFNLKVLGGGTVVQKVDKTTHRRRKGDVALLEVKGERIEAVRARYAAECFDTEKADGAPEEKKESALAGQAVTVRRQAGAEASVEGPASLDADAKKEARELVAPSDGFLPKKPVKVGDRWVADEKAVVRLLNLGPEDRGTLRSKLKEVRDVAGRRTAVIEVALVVNQKNDSMKVALDLEGSVQVDVETGWTVSVELDGPLTISGESEQKDESGKAVKITIEGGGSCKYRSSARKLGAETASAPGELPLQAPDGWHAERRTGGLVMTPGELAGGESYTVVVVSLAARVGSIRGLLEAGEATLRELGAFKPSADPERGKNDHGWEYEVVEGPLAKDGKSIVAKALGFKKADEEGIVLVISESAGTMKKYSGDLARLIASLGAPKAPPPPAAAPVASSGKVDLKFRAPAGWTQKALEGAVLLEKTENTFYDKYTFRLLILPSEPLTGTLQKTYRESWATIVTPNLETTIAPLPLMRRLASGTVCAFDTDSGAKTKANGQAVNGGLYLVARGTRYVPIFCLFFGGVQGDQLDKEVSVVIESAEIPGAGEGKVVMFDRGDLVGKWREASSSIASYVTPQGGYAGDASISTASDITLGADGTFKQTFVGVTRAVVVKEKDEGTWTLEDDVLVEKGNKTAKRRVHGVGSNGKGSWLVLDSYSNMDPAPTLRFCNPRGAFQAQWFKSE